MFTTMTNLLLVEIGSCGNIAWGWLQTVILLISVFQEARIASMSHSDRPYLFLRMQSIIFVSLLAFEIYYEKIIKIK
jgi:hypothetical protein